MNRLPASRRFPLRLVLRSLAAAAALLPSLALAHEPSIGFHIRASYKMPNFSQPGTFIRGPVVYNLPDPATSASIYAGPADSFFDVFVDVNHGTEMAAGFGVIMFIDGNGQVIFEPGPIAGNLDNNIPYALHPDFPRNTSFNSMYADPNVPGFPGNHRSVGVAAIFTAPNQNTAVNDSEGIFAMPIRAKGGVVGFFEVNFDRDEEYTGFVNSAGMIFSNDPTRSGVIEVRASIPGDMNGDGTADAKDAPSFLSALADRAAFIAEFPWLQTDYIADFNEDREITFADAAGFESACGCDLGLEPMPGDLNGDRVVDRMDAAEFIALFGAGGEGAAAAPPNDGGMLGDFNNDGHIGAADLFILQSHIGQSMVIPSPAASASPSAIPEPVSIALALAAAIFFVAWARRRS
jgi:hypothetical protein